MKNIKLQNFYVNKNTVNIMRSKVIKAMFPNKKPADKKHKKSRQRLKSNQARLPEILLK